MFIFDNLAPNRFLVLIIFHMILLAIPGRSLSCAHGGYFYGFSHDLYLLLLLVLRPRQQAALHFEAVVTLAFGLCPAAVLGTCLQCCVVDYVASSTFRRYSQSEEASAYSWLPKRFKAQM